MGGNYIIQPLGILTAEEQNIGLKGLGMKTNKFELKF